MKLYCANCGVLLTLIRKALPKLGIIVNLVQYHQCLEFPEAVDFILSQATAPKVEGMDKMVLSLNQLEPSKLSRTELPSFDRKETETRKGFGTVGTDDLRDRRFDQDKPAKSTAPNSIAEQIKLMSNSIPAHEVNEIEKGQPKEDESSEMGD